MVYEISRPPAAQLGWVHGGNDIMYVTRRPILTVKQELEKDSDKKTNEAMISYAEAFPPDDNVCRFNDWPFALFFFLVLSGFIAISILSLKAGGGDNLQMLSRIYQEGDASNLGARFMVPLIASTIIAVFFASVGFGLYGLFPAFFIYCGMVVNLLAGLGAAIMFLAEKHWSAGTVFLVITLIGAWCYWSMRSRIPFSIAVLKTVIDSIKQMPQVLLVSLVGCFVATLFSIIFSAVIIAVWTKYDKELCNLDGTNCSLSKLIGILAVIFFCGFYISEVIKNVIHCTVSGVFGCWYYGLRPEQRKPRWPAIGSLKRATTYSFGSVCFGSLIVSIIETLGQVLRLIRESLQLDGEVDGCGSVGFFFIDLIMSLLDFLARYFNHYAYCFIALYGKPYVRAAKATWLMLKQKGFGALINDNLVNVSLGLYSLFTGYMSTLSAYLYLRFIRPSHNGSIDFSIYLMITSFLIAIQICSIINETVRSGVAIFFVTLASDPDIFHANYPQRFEEIFKSYPDVLRKIDYQNA